MENYDDLGSYNGDVEHDMWVDADKNNTQSYRNKYFLN